MLDRYSTTKGDPTNYKLISPFTINCVCAYMSWWQIHGRQMTAQESLFSFYVGHEDWIQVTKLAGEAPSPWAISLAPNLVLITFSLHSSKLNKHLKHTLRTKESRWDVHSAPVLELHRQQLQTSSLRTEKILQACLNALPQWVQRMTNNVWEEKAKPTSTQ